MVSPKTAGKWAAHYRAGGAAGMANRSSRPHHSPTRTPVRVVRRIVGLRIYGDPVPGYQASAAGPPPRPSTRACAGLTSLVAAAWHPPGRRRPRLAGLRTAPGRRGPRVVPRTAAGRRRALTARLGSHARSGVAGDLRRLGPLTREPAKLYRAEIHDLIKSLGLTRRGRPLVVVGVKGYSSARTPGIGGRRAPRPHRGQPDGWHLGRGRAVAEWATAAGAAYLHGRPQFRLAERPLRSLLAAQPALMRTPRSGRLLRRGSGPGRR